MRHGRVLRVQGQAQRYSCKQDKGEATKRKAAYCEAAEKWDSDSDSDKSEDEEDLKM